MSALPSPKADAARATLSDAEVPFGFEEIFFSRTDPRGMIQAGNAVFRRVSGYPWSRLLHAPHKVVRHPAMPKGVFHLMWERIRAGQATGAYVRNRAEDGRGYWVMAVVVPLADGYLSVRIKPGSPLLQQVKDIYALLLREEAEGATPAESAARLVRLLARLGFPGYDAFQARALSAEVSHRARTVGRATPRVADALLVAAEAAFDIERETRAMREMFDTARNISINLRVLASSLGDLGRPVSAISANYSLLAADMTTWLETRAQGSEGGFGRITGAVCDGLFLGNAAEVLEEMARDFARDPVARDPASRPAGAGDPEGAGGDPTAEAGRLDALVGQYRGRADSVLPRVAREAQAMESRVTEMRRHVTGLSSIRMLCRIEGAVLRHRGGSLDRIVAQLDAFQDELEARLTRITELNHRLQGAADGL